jgi:hypothetical protein
MTVVLVVIVVVAVVVLVVAASQQHAQVLGLSHASSKSSAARAALTDAR